MKIALIGYGKMEHMIEEIALQRGHEIVCKIDVNNPEDIDSPEFCSADVAIEFTNPTAAYGNYLKAFSHNVKVVSGSTGWMKDHKEDVEKLCAAGETLPDGIVVVDAQQPRQMRQHFGQPHHREFLTVVPRIETGGAHARPADAGEFGIGKAQAQFGDQARAELVAGGFTRDECDPHDRISATADVRRVR